MANNRGFLKRRLDKAPRVLILDRNEVASVAYQLYERRGRVDGHDVEDWLQAERIVRQRHNGR